MVLLAAQVWRPVNQMHQGQELTVKLRDKQKRKLSFLLLDGAHLDRWGLSLYICIYLCICMCVCMCIYMFVPVSETQQSTSSWLRATVMAPTFLGGSGGLNSGSHTYTAGMFPPEPSLQPNEGFSLLRLSIQTPSLSENVMGTPQKTTFSQLYGDSLTKSS